MRLKTLATGSTGNAYVLTANGVSLLLDAGIAYPRLVEGIGYRTTGVLGALITHEHQDHSMAVSMLQRNGIPWYASKGTVDALGYANDTFPRRVKAYEQFTIGPFTILAFPAKHDGHLTAPERRCKEPLGYLMLNNATGERMVYATDTYYLPHTFPGVHYWLVECNYMEELLNDTSDFLAARLAQSHMSLNRLCQVFKDNDLTSCRQIVLCHMSRARGDEAIMTDAIGRITHRPVVMAHPGESIHLSKDPF